MTDVVLLLSIFPSYYAPYPQRSIWLPETELFERYVDQFCRGGIYAHRKKKMLETTIVVDPILTTTTTTTTPPPSPKPTITYHTHNLDIRTHILCTSWYTGCKRGTKCLFMHSVEELVAPFYTEEALKECRKRMKPPIDETCASQICKMIYAAHCTNIGRCSAAGNPFMKNKCVSTRRAASSGLPHCRVLCKSCGTEMMAVQIYRFKK